jgi:hypothetical protein
LIERTKSAEDKILKKRQKIAELKDRLSEHEKSLEDFVEIGMDSSLIDADSREMSKFSIFCENIFTFTTKT